MFARGAHRILTPDVPSLRAFLCGVFAVCLFAASPVHAQTPIVLVGDQDYPPLSYLDRGVARGFDVDVARAMGRVLGREVRVELMDWEQAQARVLSGQADGLIDLAMSDERRTLYDFAKATIIHDYGLFVRVGETTVRETMDLTGKHVGVTPGGFPRAFLTGRPAIRLEDIANYDEGFAELASGRLDAMAADIWVGSYIIEHAGLRGLTLAGGPLASAPAAIAIRKNNPSVQSADIERAIAAVIADGTLKRIQDTWRPTEIIFLSRERILDLAARAIAVLLLALLTATTVWALTLRRQIGKRRTVEASMVESNQRLSLALSAADMGTWRWVAETDEDTRDANLNRMLGLPPIESVHTLDDMFARVHPDDVAAVRSEFERAIRERGAYSSEFRITRPDGTERWLRGRGKPFFDDSGTLTYVTGTAIDVTEQRTNEARLKLLAHALQSAGDGIAITDPARRILYVNDAFLRTYEYTEAELLGESIDIIRAPDELPDVPDHASPADAGWRGEVWNRTKTGRLFPAALATSVVRGDDGTVVATVSVARDVTNQQLAEDALRSSEEKFYKVFQGSPDAIIINAFESGVGAILDLNESFERITGYSRAEVIGRSLQELGFFVDPNFRDAAMARLRVAGSARDVEFQARRKNGEIATLSASGETVEIGGRLCYLTISRDVTDRKRFEMHLRQGTEVNKLLLSQLDADDLDVAVIEAAHQILSVDYASLVLADVQTRTLSLEAQRGLPDARRSQGAAMALATMVLNGGQLRVFRESALRELGEPVAELVAAGLQSICVLPLTTARGTLGTLNVGSRNPGAFSQDDITLLQQLSTYVAIAIQNARAYEEIKTLKDQVSEQKLYLEEEIRVDHHFADVIGESAAIKRVLQQIETVAPTDASVLILGETGTGKELLARALHDLSARRSRTFVRLNVAALPTTLLESELFGYERGAFTGATTSKAGRMELANRGTLFLDEIGDIPLEVQPKLLRALQEQEFERLGSTRTQQVDVRLIAATNRDLARMVDEGTFRSDLFYRLNVFPVHVPPLRERKEDIPLLVRYFVQEFATRAKRHITTIPTSTMVALQEWHWPGNIRELANVIERAVIVSTTEVLQVPAFQARPAFDPGAVAPRPMSSPGSPGPPAPSSPSPMSSTGPAAGSPMSFSDGEREIILRALRDAHGIIAGPEGAAARLGMKRTTLQSKMRKLGIRRPTF